MQKFKEPIIKQVAKPSNDTLMNLKTSTSLKNLSKIKRKWLHLRSDVVNKTLLRSIKRYYLNKFKTSNKGIVKKRYKNSKSSYILRALKGFWQKEFADHQNDINFQLLAEFLFIFLGIKHSNGNSYSQDIKMEAQLIRECMEKYTFEKFKRVKSSKQFKLLVLNINKSHMEEVLSSTKTMELNKERYQLAFDELINIFE